MDLIVETDLGHDPDDLFAICYLIAAGVNIRTILISPGDPDQVAIARFICDRVGIKIPIGVSKENRTKNSSGSIHHELLNKYSYPLQAKPDGMGVDILEDVFNTYPEAECFVIGPVSSLGAYLKKSGRTVSRATMQGGFLSYDLHQYSCTKLPAFEKKMWAPTFNLNGDRPNGLNFIAADIKHRQMVGKNVCHTVLFRQIEENVKAEHPAAVLFLEAAKMYFKNHEEKKFHDPTAACLHLHPEIGAWVRGKTVKMEAGWGTTLDPEGDYICAAIDYDKLWEHILGFK